MLGVFKRPTSAFRRATLFVLSMCAVAPAAELTVTVAPPTVTVREGVDGLAEFNTNGPAWLSRTGEPRTPWMLLTVLLPPDALPQSVVVELSTSDYDDVGGEWHVAPTPPPATWRDGMLVLNWPADRALDHGQDARIYTRDALWPEREALLVDVGRLRKWRLARVGVPLVRYNPVLGALQTLRDAELTFRFERSKTSLAAVELADRIGIDVVRELCVNYADQAGPYLLPGPPRSDPGYVVITTTAIQTGSAALPNFVAHQQSRGFSVQVVTEADFGGGSGDTAAENIRGWLAAHYLTDGIQYVLFIGDPSPTSSIPMKVLYPLRDDEGQPVPHPSDYYYADLTGNWDLEGDGYAGEWPDDFGVGGVDVHWEVLVGRIPFYGSFADLDAILQKIVSYQNESDGQTAWRRNALLPMKPSDDSTPGYQLGEQVKDYVLEPESWGFHRVYDESYDLEPPPETTPCTVDGVTNVWAENPFGLVVWWTHGWAQGASGVMDTGHVDQLNDDYPSFTFQASCTNSHPESSDNLSYTLLKHGAICTIGATRASWYWVGETYFVGSSSNSGMGYEYASRVVGGASSGLALHALRQSLWNENMWPNFVVFCIYGDPSTSIVPAETGAIHNITQDTWHASVQDAVDLARDGDEIVLSPGPHTGRGNHSISLAGKAITIRSTDPSDPAVVAATVIDCEGSAASPRRAFFIRGNEGPDSVIAGLTIVNGYMTCGGAIRCDSGCRPTIRDCVFRGNATISNGGAIYNCGGAAPQIVRCQFFENSTTWGGAISSEGDSNATITACVFLGNTATERGGAVHSFQSSPTISGCAFTDNRADDRGGAVWFRDQSDGVVENCSFTDNSAVDAGGGVANGGHSGVSIRGCAFTGNAAGSGGGTWNNSYSEVLIQDCVFEGNIAGDTGGGVAVKEHSNVDVADCVFSGNHATYGGGMFVGGQSAPRISNCRFLANTASGNGGGVDINNSAPQFYNCLIGGNRATAGSGGGVIVGSGSNLTIAGTTIVANHAPAGGGIAFYSTAHEVRNAIIWGNTDGSGQGEAAQLYQGGGTLTIDYSCVQGWTGSFGGTGNHGLDPLFVDPDGPDDDPNTWADNNHRIWGSSPCADTGDPAFVPAPGETDLDGQSRIRDANGDGIAIVDMGAYEYDREDLDCDGDVDLTDLALLLADYGCTEGVCPGDIDGDSDTDLVDLAILLSHYGEGA
jgi:predicted outer membrane repeat protein